MLSIIKNGELNVIEFICALYNEEVEITDLIVHIEPYVDRINIVDDGSTDKTLYLLDIYKKYDKAGHILNFKTIPHTGLPETVKNEALKMVQDGSWVIMLDADERFGPGVLDSIVRWIKNDSEGIDYVYCNQLEVIDGKVVRAFQKSKVFRKESIRFPLNNIHADDEFAGTGIYREDWIVYHRKSSGKQIEREKQYWQTYDKLLEEGHIDEGRRDWLRGLHHFVRQPPHG